MSDLDSPTNLKMGSDCTREFQAAYENRYTWEPSFKGYKGNCTLEKDGQEFKGNFQVGNDLKPIVFTNLVRLALD